MRGSLRLSSLGLALLLLFGCGDAADPVRPSEPSQASQAPRADLSRLPVPRATRGYILISIDTLRACVHHIPRPDAPKVFARFGSVANPVTPCAAFWK